MTDSSTNLLPKLEQVANPISLLPIHLKEAALDSPSFRATCVHFGEQIDGVERWLDSYVKASSRLANEVTSLESLVATYIYTALPPPSISETALDQDYTVLALQRYNEGAKEFWSSTIRWMKKVESTVVDPIRAFINTDLAQLKSIRKHLETTQKNFENILARFAAHSKSKETSSIREDAFQLHEARKVYLKASMDFCLAAPQVRTALDKLLVKVFSDRWRDMKASENALSASITKWSHDIDRVRSWSKEMESHEKVFAKELHIARKKIEEAAESKVRPSRELDVYASSTVPYISNSNPLGSPKKGAFDITEKQGWLFLKTLTGKPARTVWIRRWFYVKDGVFGWLQQNSKFSAVEESEKVGVLLCGVRPALQEERRFCFEVKTKNSTLILQAETQADLMEWITGFEVVKRNALENPSASGGILGSSQGAPFAITPPIAPEFAAISEKEPDESHDKSNNLTIDASGPIKPSLDLRRPGGEDDEPLKKDTASRIRQKLDLSRKGDRSGAMSPGGMGNLLTTNHGLPNSPGLLSVNTDLKTLNLGGLIPTSSLAPSTLVPPPIPTNLSKSAITVNFEHSSPTTRTSANSIPVGLMANVWGSYSTPYINRLEENTKSIRKLNAIIEHQPRSRQPSSNLQNIQEPNYNTLDSPNPLTPDKSSHRRTMSASPEPNSRNPDDIDDYPPNYPLSLKAQDAQFRMLFPSVSHNDKLVLVFRATWNPSDQQEFPGRVYVTMNDIYFYSNHLGLVLISGVSFSSIAEVTSAPGKDCDFVFMHLKDGVRPEGATRVTIKTFLESHRLLQKRLELLAQNKQSIEPALLEETLEMMIKIEQNSSDSPVGDGWEDIAHEIPDASVLSSSKVQDLKASLQIDGSLDAKKPIKNTTKFRLPAHPVEFIPQGFKIPMVERKFEITAKALFHVLAGDKSAVFQILYCQRGAQKLVQTPWVQGENMNYRREIKYDVENDKKFLEISDYQVIDVMNDHLCYVITERKTAWFLPKSNFFTLVLKIVITHVAKSTCKISIYSRVEWSRTPLVGRSLIDHQAQSQMQSYASSIVDIVADQATRLGAQGGMSARKAVNIFGGIGLYTESVQLLASDLAPADLKGRKKVHYRSLLRLVSYAVRRMVITYFFVVIGWIFQIIKWVASTCNAHRFLVLALMFSVFANTFFSVKDSWNWWLEIRARSYMAGLGVKPNTIMGRSVWLKDLDEFTAQFESQISLNQTRYGTCGTAFAELLSQLDPSGSEENIQGSSIDTMMLSRISRQRERYGEQRHNLMVSLRLVGRMEREMLRSEWEEWSFRETVKCSKAKKLIGNKSKDDGNMDTESLNQWWDNYCQSCAQVEGNTKGGI